MLGVQQLPALERGRQLRPFTVVTVGVERS
jgi:hypothetical protein